MDFHLVIGFLCLLAAQASCRALGDKDKEEAVIDTIQLIQEEIRGVLDQLNVTALLPNTSCLSFNLTQLIGDEQEGFAYQYLSTFRCFLMQLSKQIPKLSNPLDAISQYSQDVELMYRKPKTQNCSLLSFEQDLDSHVFAKCLLELLEKRISKAKI